jgi:hypothetical protein
MLYKENPIIKFENIILLGGNIKLNSSYNIFLISFHLYYLSFIIFLTRIFILFL